MSCTAKLPGCAAMPATSAATPPHRVCRERRSFPSHARRDTASPVENRDSVANVKHVSRFALALLALASLGLTACSGLSKPSTITIAEAIPSHAKPAVAAAADAPAGAAPARPAPAPAQGG